MHSIPGQGLTVICQSQDYFEYLSNITKIVDTQECEIEKLLTFRAKFKNMVQEYDAFLKEPIDYLMQQVKKEQ